MHVKITYINKDKAQVILFKKVIPHIMFEGKDDASTVFFFLNFINVSDSFRKRIPDPGAIA